MKQVWILDEGSQGHVVQSRGLVRELAKVLDLQSVEISARLSVRSGFLRSMAKRALRRWNWKWLFCASHSVSELPSGKPDIIISSGPRSMLALAYFGKIYNCPSVFVQGTVDVPEGMFTAVMRPFEGQHRADFIFIPLLFTEITPAVVNAARDSFLAETPIQPTGPINTLFIGASSAKIRFATEDWQGIIQFVNDLWNRDGCQWLITTSYRTGRELEDLFRNGVAPEAILDAVWYSQAPRKVTKPYLGLASRVFVTTDSLTMLTEAVSSGRPTYAFGPAADGDDTSNTHLRYVRELEDQGLVTRLHPELGETPPPAPPIAPKIDYASPVLELLNRLQWQP